MACYGGWAALAMEVRRHYGGQAAHLKRSRSPSPPASYSRLIGLYGTLVLLLRLNVPCSRMSSHLVRGRVRVGVRMRDLG